MGRLSLDWYTQLIQNSEPGSTDSDATVLKYSGKTNKTKSFSTRRVSLRGCRYVLVTAVTTPRREQPETTKKQVLICACGSFATVSLRV